MRLPEALPRGGTIGIVSPAGATDESRLEQGIRWLEARGFRVRVGAHASSRYRYLAGRDSERLEDLRRMFADDEIDAVFSARGGFGSGRLLPSLEPSFFARAVPFVGHSDLTFLLTYLVQDSRLVAFHGPTVSEFAERPEAAEALVELLSGEREARFRAPWVLREGKATGALVGGCLSIVASLCGTPWSLRTSGCLLFLEDVGEKPFRLERMLVQLRQAGMLAHVAGLVFGEMPRCFENAPDDLAELLSEVCPDGHYPVVAGLPSGHGTGTVTLPLGVRATLARDELRVVEPFLRLPGKRS